MAEHNYVNGKCSACNKIEDGHEHVFENDVTIITPATCTTDGAASAKCLCGNVGEIIIKAPGHTPVVDEAVAPKCEETGLTEGSHCSTCGDVLVAQEEVEATGHATTKVYTVIEGVLYYAATCGCEDQREAVEAGATVEVATENDLKTVLMAGYNVLLTANIELTSAIEIEGKEVVINLGGYAITADWVDENGVVEVLWAKGTGTVVTINGEGSMKSGTGSGTNSVVSSTDGAIVNINGGYYYSASYGAVIATTRNGIVNIYGGKFEAAEQCDGKWYVLDIDERVDPEYFGEINVYGGEFVNYDPVNNNNDNADLANKVADGYHSIKNNDSYFVSKHVYESNVTNPTCEAGGYTTHTCVCGDEYTDTPVDAIGHKWDNNCDTDCNNNCGTIRETTHTPGEEATCEDAQTCTECGATITPAFGHDYVDHAAQAATCIAAGWKAYVTCENCDYSTKVEIPATGEHTYSYGKCSVCEKAFVFVSTTDEITFELGTDKTVTDHTDGSTAKATYSETVDGYTLSITGGTGAYPGSYDQTGNACIKLGTKSAAGGFTFTVPNDVTKVIIYVAKYKANTSKITVNGTSYTLSGSSNDGEYDAITVDTTATKTVTLTTVSGGYRAMVNTIVFNVVTQHVCTSDNQATCEEAARCLVCGEDVGTAKGHTNAAAVTENKVDATCSAEGSYDSVIYCSVCEAEISRETKTIDKLSHTESDWIVDVQATETTEGSQHKECTVCHEILETEVIPTLSHECEYTTEVTAPTCTEQGYTTYTCSGCGDFYIDNYVDAKGHTDGEPDVENEVAAGCANNGSYDLVVKCSECGDETSRETIIVDATGHAFVCGACVCGQKLSVETTTSMDIYANKGTTGTDTISWTSNGITFRNDKDKSSSAILATDSAYFRVYANSKVTISGSGITKVVITCTTSSYATACQNSFASTTGVTASVDGTIVTITVNSGTMDTIASSATAQWRLSKIEVTRVANYSMSDKDTETHEYTSIVVTAPTCGKVGYTTYTCKCGSHTDDEVAALEHNYESVVTAPTCVEQGYTTHTCTNCEDSYKNSYTDATGEHNFVDGKCTVCEQEEGHTHSYTSKVTAPTCVDQGYTTHTCSCGEEYVDSYVDATGVHNFVDGECTECGEPDPNARTTVTISKTHKEITTLAGVSTSSNGGSLNGKNIDLDENITVVFNKGSSTSNPAYYSESIRLYQNGATLTIKGTGMKTIVITLANDAAGDGPIAVTGGTADNANTPTNYAYTITVNEGVSEVVITTKGTDKNSRLYVANIEVQYEA